MVYLYGGADNSNASPISWITGIDTINNRWVNNQIYLPEGLYAASCAAVGTNVYIMGGRNKSGTFLNTIYCHDTENNTISTLPCTLPTGTYTMGCGVVGDKIYLFGGFKTANKIVCVDTTNKMTSTVEIRGIPNGQEITACAIETDIYLFGFSNAYVYKFLAPIGAMVLESGKLQIFPKADTNPYLIVNTDNVKIESTVNKVCKGNANNEAEQVEAALYKNNSWITI